MHENVTTLSYLFPVEVQERIGKYYDKFVMFKSLVQANDYMKKIKSKKSEYNKIRKEIDKYKRKVNDSVEDYLSRIEKALHEKILSILNLRELPESVYSYRMTHPYYTFYCFCDIITDEESIDKTAKKVIEIMYQQFKNAELYFNLSYRCNIPNIFESTDKVKNQSIIHVAYRSSNEAE